MAKTQAQTTTGRTRIKNGLSVTLYGAGAKGHEGNTAVGAGLEPGFIVAVPTGQTANAIQIEQPEGTVVWGIDAGGGEVLGASNISHRTAKVAVTSANLLAMYTTPVVILAAPATGIAIVVLQVIFEMTTTATVYANGGIVGFQYDTTAHFAGTAVHAGSIPATVVNAAAGLSVTALYDASGTNGLTVPTAKGIYISNQTAPFITGTGTAIVKITYDLLTTG